MLTCGRGRSTGAGGLCAALPLPNGRLGIMEGAAFMRRDAGVSSARPRLMGLRHSG